MAHTAPYFTEDIGDPISFEPANPVMGNIWFAPQVPVNQVWILDQISGWLTTGITVGARTLRVEVDTGTPVRMHSSLQTVTQLQSVQIIYSWVVNGQVSAAPADGRLQGSLPEFVIPPGGQIMLACTNIKPTDQLSNITYSIRRWHIQP